MAITFFGFGIAPSMFPENCLITRHSLTPEEAGIEIGKGVVSCLNPSHKATIEIMKSRFGLEVGIPAKAPVVNMVDGDSILVMGVSGLPRLEGRHEYTQEEVEGAKFSFSIFKVAKGRDDQGSWY
jgi:hypothetical protein